MPRKLPGCTLCGREATQFFADKPVCAEHIQQAHDFPCPHCGRIIQSLDVDGHPWPSICEACRMRQLGARLSEEDRSVVYQFLQSNQLVHAVKEIRERLGCTIRDAMDLGEGIRNGRFSAEIERHQAEDMS